MHYHAANFSVLGAEMADVGVRADAGILHGRSRWKRFENMSRERWRRRVVGAGLMDLETGAIDFLLQRGPLNIVFS